MVVLAYLPADDIYNIARKFTGIHLILGGRCQASSAPYELFAHTLIAYLGDEGCTAGRIDDPSFPMPQSPHPTLPPFAAARIAILDKDLPEDASMTPILTRTQDRLGRRKATRRRLDPRCPAPAASSAPKSASSAT